ncbi:MAG: HAMP domain-containing sensor histidine kinase, partial [Cyanobacteria bacterium J06555_12]
SMRMSLQMLKHASHPDKRQRYLSMLESECEREIRLVEDLLLMRELTVQLDSEQRHRLELGQLVGSIVEANSSAPHAQHVDITFATSPHKYWVHLNEHYLSRVLNELLENACKHSGSRGRVSIDVSERACQHNWVAIGVRNDGEIPQAELQHLFDTFHRVSQGDRWQTSGTGLGLALVKQIVERLGGSISVTSAGGWVQFDLHLPLEHPPKIPAATTQPLATAAPMAMSRSSR